jgi:hypothetical protein
VKSQADVHALRLKLKKLKDESRTTLKDAASKERLLFTGLKMLKRSSVKTT